MAISGLSLNCDRVGGPHLDLWTTGVEPGRSRALDPRLQPHVHESPSSCICGGQRVACTSKYRSEHPPQQPGSGSPPGSTERSSSRGMSRTTARLRPRDECGGTNPPKVIDGPYPESKELLAGYRMVDVDSLERALGIAAQSSAAPGPGGVPIRQPIEVRQVMGAPD